MTYCIPTPIPTNLPVIEYSNYVSPNDVLNGCLKFFGITKAMLKNKSREREVLKPRQMITYVLRIHAGLTLNNVAKIVGYKDHTMTVHTVSKVSKDLINNTYLKAQYESLIKYLGL